MLQNLPHADYWLILCCVFGPNKGLPAWTLIKCFELNWFYATARMRNSFCAITKRPNWKQYWNPQHSNCVRFLTPNNEQRKLNVIKTSNAFVSGFVFQKKKCIRRKACEFSSPAERENGENQSTSAGRDAARRQECILWRIQIYSDKSLTMGNKIVN